MNLNRLFLLLFLSGFLFSMEKTEKDIKTKLAVYLSSNNCPARRSALKRIKLDPDTYARLLKDIPLNFLSDGKYALVFNTKQYVINPANDVIEEHQIKK